VIDPVSLAQDLIRRPSVTPQDAGALDVLAEALTSLGFSCHRLRFDDKDTPSVDNLYARLGKDAPNFCFAGHTDVVPPGDATLWRHDPFAAEIHDGILYGRGAADMKSAIAAFVAAVARIGQPVKGSVSLLITGDEEGAAINGTPKLLSWLRSREENIDHCVVGEPTSSLQAGDTLKIGRRGSINFRITVKGLQGHVGYPRQARNPIPVLAGLTARLSAHDFADGNAHFDPSTLAFTSLNVGNAATNVIPAEARGAFNIRFNDSHTPESLTHWVEQEAAAAARASGCKVMVETSISGVSFLTPPGTFTQMVSDAVESITGKAPQFSTSGGTSDARFIKDICPVVELGLAGTTMHKTDECVAVSEILRLTDIYAALLSTYLQP
jgi:succinyl-diaminopimelate desuccinylase